MSFGQSKSLLSKPNTDVQLQLLSQQHDCRVLLHLHNVTVRGGGLFYVTFILCIISPCYLLVKGYCLLIPYL